MLAVTFINCALLFHAHTCQKSEAQDETEPSTSQPPQPSSLSPPPPPLPPGPPQQRSSGSPPQKQNSGKQHDSDSKKAEETKKVSIIQKPESEFVMVQGSLYMHDQTAMGKEG